MEPVDFTRVERGQNNFTGSLLQAVFALRANLEPEQKLEVILEHIHKTIPFERAFIGVVEGENIRVVSIKGYEEASGCGLVVGDVFPLNDYPHVLQWSSSHQPNEVKTTNLQIAEILSSAASSIAQISDIESLIGTLLEHLRTIAHPDAASVTLAGDELHSEMHIVKGYGIWAESEKLPFLAPDKVAKLSINRKKSRQSNLSIKVSVNCSGQGNQNRLNQNLHWLIVPLTAAGKIIGQVELGKTGQGSFSQEQIWWAEALAAHYGSAIENIRLKDQVQLSSERLQFVTRKLVEIQEKERSYVARELHDETGQLLSSLKISLSRLEQDPACPFSIQQRLQGIKTTADSILENLHRLAVGLRPAVLDHLGLVAALEEYTSKLNSEQLSVQFKAMRFEGKRLPPDLEVCFYRIVQEALTNVIRHACASNVGVLLEWNDGKVKIFIEDDGVGFITDKIDNKEHIGLLSMKERAEIIGGEITIESILDKGTTVIVEAPDGY